MAANAIIAIARLRGIYVILNEEDGMLALARAVLDAGIGIVQYRAKRGVVAENLTRLREMSRERGALLIVNDDWCAAANFDCDGVHLGPEDDGFANVASVRAALGERLIGLSCGNFDEVTRAGAAGADYLGIGSVYATPSKADAGEPIGIAELRRLAQAATSPVAAIGGITVTNLREVRASGVAMAAVLSAVSEAQRPDRAARDLIAQWR